MSQPHVIATGPPLLNAMKYEVRQPARIEMIVKLIAKFWNPPIARNSSWAVSHLVEDLLVLRGVDCTGVPVQGSRSCRLPD